MKEALSTGSLSRDPVQVAVKWEQVCLLADESGLAPYQITGLRHGLHHGDVLLVQYSTPEKT